MVYTISDEAKAQIKALYAQGLSRHQIAKAVGCSPSTVASHLPPNSFDRSRTAAAVEAKQIDNKARRARLAEMMLDRAIANMERLNQSTYTHRIKVADASYVVTDEQVDSEDERNHAQAVTSLAVAAAKLEAMDTDTGLSTVKSVLGALGQALGVSSPES